MTNSRSRRNKKNNIKIIIIAFAIVVVALIIFMIKTFIPSSQNEVRTLNTKIEDDMFYVKYLNLYNASNNQDYIDEELDMYENDIFYNENTKEYYYKNKFGLKCIKNNNVYLIDNMKGIHIEGFFNNKILYIINMSSNVEDDESIPLFVADENDKNKIFDNIQFTLPTKDFVYVVDEKNDLYAINNKYEKSFIDNDVINMINDEKLGLFYTKENGTFIYADNTSKKISDNTALKISNGSNGVLYFMFENEETVYPKDYIEQDITDKEQTDLMFGKNKKFEDLTYIDYNYDLYKYDEKGLTKIASRIYSYENKNDMLFYNKKLSFSPRKRKLSNIIKTFSISEWTIDSFMHSYLSSSEKDYCINKDGVECEIDLELSEGILANVKFDEATNTVYFKIDTEIYYATFNQEKETVTAYSIDTNTHNNFEIVNGNLIYIKNYDWQRQRGYLMEYVDDEMKIITPDVVDFTVSPSGELYYLYDINIDTGFDSLARYLGDNNSEMIDTEVANIVKLHKFK